MLFTALFTRSHSSSPPTAPRTLLDHPLQKRQRSNTLLSISNQPIQGALNKKPLTSQQKKPSKVYRPKTSRGRSCCNKENIDPLDGRHRSSYPFHHESQLVAGHISTRHHLYPPITLHESSERENLKRPDVVLSPPDFRLASGMRSKTKASRPLLRVDYSPPFQAAPQRCSPSSISSGESSNATCFSAISCSQLSETSLRQIGSRSNTYLGTYLGPSIQNELEPDGSWLFTGRLHSPLSHASPTHSVLNQEDAMDTHFDFETIQPMQLDEPKVPNPNKALDSSPEPIFTTNCERFDDQCLDGRWTHGAPYQAFITPLSNKNNTLSFFPFQHLE